jgi:hypothetical protein
VKSKALQDAVFARLNHSSVTSLLSTKYTANGGSIMTDVPQAADSADESYFPFVTFGNDAFQAFDTKDQVGSNALVQIDVWARGGSMIGLKNVYDAIDARMRRQSMTITGATHIETIFEGSTTVDDPDGKTKHLVIRYRVLFLET